MMLARRLQILADGQEIHIRRAQIVHYLQDFMALLAEAHHDARLGEDGGVDLLDPLQQPDRMEVARAWAHAKIARGHGLEIVVEAIRFRRADTLERAVLAQKIGREKFDRRGRTARADRANGLGEMLGTAVIEVVAVHRSDDDVAKPELEGRLRDVRSEERRVGKEGRWGWVA